jgi:hypothetical protein
MRYNRTEPDHAVARVGGADAVDESPLERGAGVNGASGGRAP